MRKTIIIAIALFCVVSITSCTSISSRVKAAVSGYPLWYYETSTASEEGQKAFTAIGQAQTERQAELLALSNMSENISAYLGFDISREAFRELVTLGTIENLTIEITEHFVHLENGVYTVLLFAVADEDSISGLRTVQAVENESRSGQIISLVLEGDQYIKDNQDMNGVASYIKSMVLSYGFSEIEKQYSFDEIQKEVFDILNSTTLSVEDADPSNVTSELRVRRKESVIPSKIQDCKVKASYMSVDANGNEYSDSFKYSTDKNGKINFRIFNNAIVKKGKVVFEIDINEEIEELRKVSPAAASMIEELIRSKSVSFEYDREYKSGKIGLCFAGYDSEGEMLDSEKYCAYLISVLKSDSIDCGTFEYRDGYTDNQLIENAKKKGSFGCFAIIRSGISDIQKSSTGITSVTIEGQIVFYDANFNILYTSGIIYSNGFGHSSEEAIDNAFDSISKIAISALKASYV